LRFAQPHSWDVTPAEAKSIQTKLASQVKLVDAIALNQITAVAGIDNSYLAVDGQAMACAAVVVLTFPALELVETTVAWQPVTFPYVPGLLSFREAPAVLAACAEVKAEPDVILLDGQGYAHPRRFGLATHIGVILDKPTIGCAKSRLVGHYDEPDRVFGARTPLIDRGEVVGAAVRTKPRHKPLFVSPGQRIAVATAVAITLACSQADQFMPTPTRLAHEIVTRERRRRLQGAE
jgi:deoxyribonuclease V